MVSQRRRAPTHWQFQMCAALLPLRVLPSLWSPQLRENWALLFVKQYNPDLEKLSYVGRIWVMKSYKGEQLQQVICKLLQIPDQQLEIYEVRVAVALLWHWYCGGCL
jgi:hypothetical protein